MAKAGFRILDSDLHLMEPPDLYERYLDQGYRDRRPQATSSRAGHYAGWIVDSQPVPPWTENPEVLKANERLDAQSQAVMKDGWAKQFDASSSLRAMDVEGIDVAVMFLPAPVCWSP